jgi:hypothetical protein
MKKFNWQYWYVNKLGYLLKSNVDDKATTLAHCKIPEEGIDLYVYQSSDDQGYQYQVCGMQSGTLVVGYCASLTEAVEQAEKSAGNFFHSKKLAILQEKVLHLKNAIKYLFSFNIKQPCHPIVMVIKKMFDDILR